MFPGLKQIAYNGRDVWPLIEGGKGWSATNGESSGAWAAAGGVGTVSAVNADSYDPTGKIVPQVYDGLTRRERHEELIRYAVDGAVAQVERAHDVAGGRGAININVLWEMGGAQQVLNGVLERTRGWSTASPAGRECPTSCRRSRRPRGPLPADRLVGRAFRALWKRAYHKVAELMAAVVYEDPWLAGGHNACPTRRTRARPRTPSARAQPAPGHARVRHRRLGGRS